MLLKGVVIGSTVESAYYALVNDHHFIPTRKTPPLFYRKISIPILGTDSDSEVWSKLNLFLGLLSKKVCYGEFSNIRISEEEIKIITDNTSFKYSYDKAYVFDSTGITAEATIIDSNPKTYTVIDDLELSVLGPKRYHLDSISGDTGLARELHFYSSGRVDGSDYITDCVVESELTREQIISFDNSDSMVRFVVERHLTSLGVKGRYMKDYKNGDPKYRKPKVKHVSRFVIEKDNNKYKSTSKIAFIDPTLEEIIEKSSKR
jgi:hypothetical protein